MTIKQLKRFQEKISRQLMKKTIHQIDLSLKEAAGAGNTSRKFWFDSVYSGSFIESHQAELAEYYTKRGFRVSFYDTYLLVDWSEKND